VVLEGLAMGVPVVATNVGGPAEIVREGLDGRLLPPRQPARWAEAVSLLLAQPELRAALGRNGRERVKQSFGRAAYLQAEIDSYQEALAVASSATVELASRR
jgi:glycosyltransferase involved in cell wall biosynthesis